MEEKLIRVVGLHKTYILGRRKLEREARRRTKELKKLREKSLQERASRKGEYEKSLEEEQTRLADQQKSSKIDVLKGLSLEVQEGEMLGIVGTSGAGKSTLLNLIGTLERPTEGSIFFRDLNVFQLDDNGLAHFRNQKVGFIFQFHHLLPEFSALENTMMPALIQRRPKQEARRKAVEILREVGLAERLNHKPGELSGGEQQRVAVSRCLMNDPEVILADEPTGNLDRKTGGAIYELLRRLNHEKGKTLVVVTHSPDLAQKMDRVVRLVDGLISMN